MKSGCIFNDNPLASFEKKQKTKNKTKHNCVDYIRQCLCCQFESFRVREVFSDSEAFELTAKALANAFEVQCKAADWIGTGTYEILRMSVGSVLRSSYHLSTES